MKRVLLVVMLASVVAWGGKKKPAKAPAPPPPPPTEPSDKLVEALGEKSSGMLTGATKVTAYTVRSQQGVRPNPQLMVGADFERAGKGRELTAAELKQLRGIVYDEKSFKYAPPPCSNFVPEVALLATSENDIGTLELLYSFKCGALMFFSTKTAGRSLPGAQIDFRPSKKQMLELVKGLLPQEPMVQALK